MSALPAAGWRSLAVLLRWLGPWAGAARAPGGVRREAVALPGPRPFTAWLYRPRRPPSGSLLLLPGLHYDGPADPRLDRFARILAASGLVVLAPFLPAMCSLILAPSLHDDAARALDALLATAGRPAGKPGLFSISFGALPATRLLGERAADLSGAVLFGGYADFDATVRFAVHGDGARPHDPLNAPVVFMNVVDTLPGAAPHREALLDAMRRFVSSTWGRPEMKARERWEPVARAAAAALPAPVQQLGLVVLGAQPGRGALLEAALAAPASARAWLDPRPHAARAGVPVSIVHGAADDVIPFEQAAQLAAALPAAARAGTWITGLYAHSAGHGVAGAAALGRELRTLVGVLRVLAGLGRAGRVSAAVGAATGR